MVVGMGFNESTLLGRSSHRYEEVLLRQHAHLTWNDSDGSHGAVVEGRMVVGTASGVDLIVREPTVSRLHAELEPRASGLWLRDLGSRNGSFVDGVRVECACVPERGHIRLGALEMAVRYGLQPSPVALSGEDRFGSLLGASTAMRDTFAGTTRPAI